MNLIAHFICAANHEPALQVGSVLPDLLGIFSRKPRVNAIEKLWRAESTLPPGMGALLAGIRFHHHVDGLFHRAPLFLEGSEGLRIALNGAGEAPGLRRFFAAHLLLELYFDQILLEEFPDCSEAFYEAIAGAGERLLREFALLHPDVKRGPLLSFLDRIVAARFVEDYRTMEGILHRVERILGRYRQRAMTAEERRAAEGFLEERKAGLRSELLQFVETMQQWEGITALAALPGQAGTAAVAAGPSGQE